MRINLHFCNYIWILLFFKQKYYYFISLSISVLKIATKYCQMSLNMMISILWECKAAAGHCPNHTSSKEEQTWGNVYADVYAEKKNCWSRILCLCKSQSEEVYCMLTLCTFSNCMHTPTSTDSQPYTAKLLFHVTYQAQWLHSDCHCVMM